MLRFNFEKMLKARGIEKPFSYLVNAGFSKGLATKIKKNKIGSINLQTLEKLSFILRCTPNDLLEWTPDEEFTIDAEHPLNEIKKSDKIADIIKTLNAIPLSQVESIDELINVKIMENQKNTPLDAKNTHPSPL